MFGLIVLYQSVGILLVAYGRVATGNSKSQHNEVFVSIVVILKLLIQIISSFNLLLNIFFLKRSISCILFFFLENLAYFS